MTQPPAAFVVALGPDRYRVERPFFAPAGPGMVSDVAVGPDGLVHVLLRGDALAAPVAQPVVTLDPAGREVARWGEAVADGHMLAVHPDGRLFVVDRDRHRVLIFRDRRLVGMLGETDTPLMPFNHPSSVGFAADGTILVADGYANHRIHRFAPDGTPRGGWGTFGRAPGAFLTPHDVAVLQDGRVAVVDRENDRVQLFSPEGAVLAVAGNFYQPMAVWAEPSGTLLVTDKVPTLTRLSADGTVLARCRPVLNGAHGLAAAADGTIYLAEMTPSRISRLVPPTGA
jgi:peptidylglycine monooxygenase